MTTQRKESRMTIRVYAVGVDGRAEAAVDESACEVVSPHDVSASQPPALWWPDCECARCDTGHRRYVPLWERGELELLVYDDQFATVLETETAYRVELEDGQRVLLSHAEYRASVERAHEDRAAVRDFLAARRVVRQER